MAPKDISTEIQENGFAFPRAAHWRLRTGNGYKRLKDSDADVGSTREGPIHGSGMKGYWL